jgi:hypothetical protein
MGSRDSEQCLVSVTDPRREHASTRHGSEKPIDDLVSTEQTASKSLHQLGVPRRRQMVVLLDARLQRGS